MGRRERNAEELEGASASGSSSTRPTKRLKMIDDPDSTTAGDNERPKSRKELRAERKAARMAAKTKTPEEIKAERKRLAQQRRKEEEKEAFKEMLRQERERKKMRKKQKEKSQEGKKKKQSAAENGDEEQEMARRLVDEIKYGRTDAASGMTTLPNGVQYRDVVVGKQGPDAQSKNLVTVKYRLTGGKLGSVIDSSSKFTFRVGKGEVIQGFDVGVRGMRPGGRRQVVVPPKAGYGSQDIGAGPGAVLHFDITLLTVA